MAGLTAKPIDQLTINGDFSIGYNDNSFTRVDPRQVQSYKVHATYKPKMWATIDGAVEIHENRDDVTTVSNLEHDRSYSFTTTLMPNERLAISFGYNYWDVYNQADICFNYSITYTNPAPPPTTLPVSTSPPGVATTACNIPGASVGAAGLETLSTYASTDHFAHAEVTWKPVQARYRGPRLRRQLRPRQLDLSQSAHAFRHPRITTTSCHSARSTSIFTGA